MKLICENYRVKRHCVLKTEWKLCLKILSRMDGRKGVLKTLKRVIDTARSREIVIRALCDTDWCRKLDFLSAETLIKKFKFVIGNCKFSTIYVMYKKGLFSTNARFMRYAADCIKGRNLSGSTRADEILRGKDRIPSVRLRII